MKSAHLLSADDLSKQDALELLATAKELAAITDGPNKKLPTLRGKTVVNLFFEDSTRTRISFETAAKRLSADVINFSAKGSSVSKGESLKDTAQTLQAMGADAVVIRHGSSGAAKRLADSKWIQATVINAGDGTHEHPTQALLDAFTIKQHLRSKDSDLSGVKVLIVGDILHSRVARSNVILLTKLGAKVVLVSYRLSKLSKSSIVMHPGPMNRGLEISADSADDIKSVIIDQVRNGVAVRMAVLYQLLGGAPIGAAND